MRAIPSGLVLLALAAPSEAQIDFVGEFLPGPPPSGNSSGSTSADQADFDLDGVLDIVTLNARDQMWVLLGDRRGGYEPPLSHFTGTMLRRVVAHDFTGDGAPDVVVSRSSPGNVNFSLYVGDGEGGFGARTTIATGTRGALAALDADGDGLQDLAIGETWNTIAILRGDGLGGFAPPVPYASSDGLTHFEVADVDEDGDPDIVAVCDVSYNQVAVHRNDGAGGFANPVILDCWGDFPSDIAVGDFDGDRHLDLFTRTHFVTFENCLWYGDGAGNFTSAAITGPSSSAIDAGDFDLDGADDLAEHDRVRLGLTTPFRFGFDGMPYVMDHNADRIPDVALIRVDGVSIVRTGTRWTPSTASGLWHRRTGRTDWIDAELVAGHLGGHLATVRSAAENEWIRANLGWSDYFIGLTDVYSEGSWVWASGEPVTYTNWAPGQPDDAGGADFCVVDPVTGLWHDEPFESARPGIVELAANDCDGDGWPDSYAIQAGLAQDTNGDGVPDTCVPPVYCTSNANSTGVPADVLLSGIPAIGIDTLTFQVRDLPPGQFGYFLMSDQAAFVPLFGGSQGDLCLGLPIVRFAADILVSSPLGEVDFAPDFTALPNQTVIGSGETWRFQCWYRDANPGPTSNTSHAVAVTFSADARPRVSLLYPTRNVPEQPAQITVPVRLSRTYHQDVLVPWAVSGTATPQVDWRVESPNPLVVPAGATQADLVITIAGDGAAETNETGVVSLLPSTNGRPGAYRELVVTIVDDD